MRILQIGPLPPEIGGRTRGGVASNAWGLATKLAARGHDIGFLADNLDRGAPSNVESVSIFSTGAGLGARVRSAVAPSLRETAASIKDHFGGSIRLDEAATGLHAYRSTIEQFKPDLIHVHHLEHRFPFAFYSARGVAPVVTTVHSSGSMELGDDDTLTRNRQLVARNLDLATNLIFVSDFVRRRYDTIFPDRLAKLNTDVVHNAIDRALFRPADRADARERLGIDLPMILFVGSVIATKQVDLLLEAARLLKSRDYPHTIRIIGDGPLRPQLEEHAGQIGVADSVVFEGSRKHSDLLYYYNAADVLAMPSKLEGFPVTVVEAMACGCPVVGTECAVAEAIGATEAGLVCAPNAESLAAAVQQLLDHPPGRAAVAAASEPFDWQAVLPQFERIYERVCRDGEC